MNLSIPEITLALGQANDPASMNMAIQLLVLLTILTLAPSILILVTSFTRILIVLGFVRNALGTQQSPPNQILAGIALFATFFVMSPVIDQINTKSIIPYNNGSINLDVALQNGIEPIREFMFRQTRKSDLLLFVKLTKLKPKNKAEIPTHVLIISFVVSELKTAFQMGFVLYIPFLILDITIASILMSMGMMMLPPVMISLPFKILLFIMIDGWSILLHSLVLSFN
jgi:flagellar biosynthesis protein FliP